MMQRQSAKMVANTAPSSGRLAWACVAIVLAVVVATTWTTEPAHGGLISGLRRIGAASNDKNNNNNDEPRQIALSEFSLRNSIETTNLELRQLKRDFAKHMSDLYMGFRLHRTIGYERARNAKLYVASANILVAEQFAEMLIQRHIIERRLQTGLKMVYVKLLPMQTLVKLYQRYNSFEWLRYQQQIDIRPKFPQASEQQLVVLYQLIGLRAQVRAAEDVLALTSDNIERILQMAQWYLVEAHDNDKTANANELQELARHTKQVLDYYLDEVVGWRERLHQLYADTLEQARPLAKGLARGNDESATEAEETSTDDENQAKEDEQALVQFLDRLINVEALDIGLNEEAKRLEYPPTISKQLIYNLQESWIPAYLLQAIQADRRLLVANRKRVLHLLRLDPDRAEADLAEWALVVNRHICTHFISSEES